MIRFCQVPRRFFAPLAAVSLVPAVLSATQPPAQPVPTSISAHLTPWTPRPFSEIVLDDPDLASCYLISPRLLSSASPPPASLDESAVATALTAQLDGLIDPTAREPVSVTIGSTEGPAIDTVVHGAAAVVLVPKTEPPSPPEVARSLAPAMLAAGFRTAAPDRRCTEPLLAVAEALADSGSLALAALPSTLRPVRDWLEPRDAVAALTAFLDNALDPSVHWQSRRASLAEMRRVGGASPQLGAATALLVEALGDAPRARREPFDFLLAWQKGSGGVYPPMPRSLRRALAHPLQAGLPKEKDQAAREDRRELERDTLERLVASGAAQIADVVPSASPAVRLEVAARLRAQGAHGLCDWLRAGPLPVLRTGCRSEGEEGGLVFARPRGDGFEVDWKLPGGDEGPLLVWRRWVLSPVVAPATGELWFLDPTGVWRVPLDARTPPRLAASGSFRHLTLAPDGTVAACARWPGGEAVAVEASGVREIAVGARAGVAWLDRDLLVASDGDKLSLASLQGETRGGVFAVPCCHGLATVSGQLVASVGPPCLAGLARVVLPEHSVTRLIELPDGPLGVVGLPSGALVFGTADGLVLWRSGGAFSRIGAGLTPGPG